MMGFVHLAEGIFEGFGWKDVKNIDLPALTKKGKQPGEPAALGILYFRYGYPYPDHMTSKESNS